MSRRPYPVVSFTASQDGGATQTRSFASLRPAYHAGMRRRITDAATVGFSLLALASCSGSGEPFDVAETNDRKPVKGQAQNGGALEAHDGGASGSGAALEHTVPPVPNAGAANPGGAAPPSTSTSGAASGTEAVVPVGALGAADRADPSWTFPASLNINGEGACQDRTPEQLVEEIREQWPELADISEAILSDPLAAPASATPTASAASPSSAASSSAASATSTVLLPPPPALAPATPPAHYQVSMNEDSFRFAFYRGEGCALGACELGDYWYFQTDAACEPQSVGQYSAVDLGDCIETSGEPLWGRPSPVDQWKDCSTDRSPQDISGRYAVFSLPFAELCSESDAGSLPGFIELELVIDPTDELGKTIVYLEGSGSDWVDGVRIEGTVERQRVRSREVRVTADDCPVTQELYLDIDLESRNFAPPGATFGYFDIRETADSSCAGAGSSCERYFYGHIIANPEN